LVLAEINQAKFVCIRQNDINTLTIALDELSEVNCYECGFKLEINLDLNGNLILELNEVQITKYTCLSNVGSGVDNN
jgi:hypothetical protein